MTGDGEQRDVRESLGNLERRLLDLERELRTDASEDATVAKGAPAPKGKGKRADREAGEREERGAVAAPPAPPQGPDTIDLFAQDARAKVDALRETLNGLTSATDRLRETAQTVVEDHGRALVRLERATGTPAPVVMPTAAAAAVTPPPEKTVEPDTTTGPEVEAEPTPEPEPAPEPVPSRTVHLPRAPSRTVEPEPEPEVTPEPEPEPAPDEPVAGGDTPTIPPPPDLPWLSALPSRRLLIVLATIAVLVCGYALITNGGKKTTETPAGPTGIAATDDAITAAGGGITAIPQLRTGIEEDVRSDLCNGKTAAAIHVVTPGGKGWSCPGIRQVAAPVLVASGFARQTKGGRTCVSVPAAPGVDRRRRDEALTEQRDAAVRGADRGRAFAAGIAFDRRNGLTLLSGASAPGKTCIKPTRETLSDGSYPLSTRLILYSTAAAADSDEVRQAASRLRSYFKGTPPLYAVVLTK